MATSHLRAAHDIATRLGAEPLRGEIGRLARHARITVDESRGVDEAVADPLGLTEREAEVIRLVAAGRSNQQIADFCENTFGVKFPMFAKSSVKGPEASPMFRQLAQLSGTAPRWNFHKYLIARDGRVVDQYSSLTAPDSRALVRAIEEQLAIAPPAR